MSDWPPPYEPPVTPILRGATMPWSASSPARYWESRAS